MSVTILTDENGVQREYREVKRTPDVGDRIKITRFSDEEVNVITRLKTKNFDDGSGYIEDAINEESFLDAKEDQFVVLEPTDIVIVDGVRYREEKRKAAVGERVLVFGHRVDKANGVFVVEKTGPNDMIHYSVNGKRGYGTPYNHGDKTNYVVLTPVNETTASNPVTLSDLQSEVASLKRRVAELEISLRVAKEDIVLIEEGVAEEIERLKERFFPPTLSMGDVEKTVRKLGGVKTAQELRDEIVEEAKRDVAELETKWKSSKEGGASFWPKECANDGFIPVHFVDYVVNREKRTVVALIRELCGKKVVYRGKAKCAPNDCFNVHIGKAIALRRALGLPVPDEYLNAPQPTEVRVGDVIGYHLAMGYRELTIVPSGADIKVGETATIDSIAAEYGKIIDDSRDQTEVSA